MDDSEKIEWLEDGFVGLTDFLVAHLQLAQRWGAEPVLQDAADRILGVRAAILEDRAKRQ
jgi:hypothetical protein